jgi:hypothetical protein
MLRQFRKALRCAALAAVAALGANGTAQATLVVGVFDPSFGVALPGVNFAGTAQFTISQDCLNLALPLTGAFIYSTYNCGGGGSGMGFLGAHVDFTGTSTGQVDFLANPAAVLGMYVKDHQVIGVQSTVIGPATSTLPGALQFDLLFGLLNPSIGSDEDHFPGSDGDNDLDDFPASTFQTTSLFLVTAGCTPGSAANACQRSNPAQTTFVPEPGSLALVLAALGAGWVTRSKKRRGPAAGCAA